jgi:hypothetical protein
MKCPPPDQENSPLAKGSLGVRAAVRASIRQLRSTVVGSGRVLLRVGDTRRIPSSAMRFTAPDLYTKAPIRTDQNRKGSEGEPKQVTVLFVDLQRSIEFPAGL